MSIFNYNDYKAFFRETIKSKGRSGRGEFRKMSEYLNVHATLISQVLSGDKDFTSEQVVRLAKYFGLAKVETRYLLLLVEIERAGSKDVRDHLVEMKNEILKNSQQLSQRMDQTKELSDEQKAIFYSSWVYSAIHLVTSLEKDVDFAFVCKRLNLSPERVTDCLNFLKGAGIIISENDKLKNGVTRTHVGKNSPFIMKHHANWRVKALEKSENLTDEELMYSVSVSLSQEDFKKLREEIVTFIQRFLKTVHASPAEELAHLNIDFFQIN